jgi:hypothetical protein
VVKPFRGIITQDKDKSYCQLRSRSRSRSRDGTEARKRAAPLCRPRQKGRARAPPHSLHHLKRRVRRGAPANRCRAAQAPPPNAPRPPAGLLLPLLPRPRRRDAPPRESSPSPAISPRGAARRNPPSNSSSLRYPPGPRAPDQTVVPRQGAVSFVGLTWGAAPRRAAPLAAEAMGGPGGRRRRRWARRSCRTTGGGVVRRTVAASTAPPRVAEGETKGEELAAAPEENSSLPRFRRSLLAIDSERFVRRAVACDRRSSFLC